MWRKSKITVNKMFRELLSKVIISNSNQHAVVYPHANYKYRSKLLCAESLKQTIHMFTPLIVITSLYI